MNRVMNHAMCGFLSGSLEGFQIDLLHGLGRPFVVMLEVQE
jgi:hypothetical protein